MKKEPHRERESGETIMNLKGWVFLGGVGLLATACGGRGVNVVGELNSSAGANGSAGSGQGSMAANTGGSAEQLHGVFYEGPSEVRAMAASSTTLYWVEYGSEDSLGNFQNDGRLLARDFDSEEVRVLADDLPGAYGVAVTARHAYVYVDRYLHDGGPRPALVRMTLAGADYALVRLLQPSGNGSCGCLVSVTGAAYFGDDDSVFRVPDEAPTPTKFLDEPAFSMTADGTTLFYKAEDTGVWQAPLSTGVASRLSTQVHRSLQTSGAYVYGLDIEDASKVFLARIPKDGSASWERLAPGYVGDYGGSLQLVDELFFHDLQLPEGSPGCSRTLSCWKIVAGKLEDTAAAQTVVELPKAVTAWVGTTAGVFWTSGAQIRQVPLADE
jgi:hypothetical protein